MKIRKIIIPLLALFLLVLSACNLSDISSFLNPTVTEQISSPNTDSNRKVTPTFTPFQPMEATATLKATTLPTKTISPQPTSTVLTPTPSIPKGQVNIMLFGNDYRPTSGYRTDTMVLVSINTIEKTVNVISFPRDLYVEIPDHNYDRLNTALPYGGFELFQQTMKINFNFQPDYYMMTNFNNFANIINSLGGIDVNAARNLYDTCDLPQAKNGYCSAGPGIVHMDGETALWYVRSRNTSNDFDRNRRQQEVLKAILNNLLQLDVISNASDLYDSYQNAVQTNLDLSTFLTLLPTAIYLNQEGHLNQYAIDSSFTTSYWTPQGAAVLLPNQEKIQELILQVIYNQ